MNLYYLKILMRFISFMCFLICLELYIVFCLSFLLSLLFQTQKHPPPEYGLFSHYLGLFSCLESLMQNTSISKTFINV